MNTHMHRRSVLQAGASAFGGLLMQGTAFGQQQYPNGPVNIILPLQAGSAADVTVRHTAERLAARYKSAFVIENIPSAAGLVGLEKLSLARNDGQTMAALTNSLVTILPHLQPGKIKVDTRKDFVAIAGISNVPTFFAVPKQSPIKSIKDLITMARKAPDRLTYSSGGIGSPQHLAAEMFNSYVGVKLTHVPYRGASQATVALVSAEVDLMSMALSLAKPFLTNDRVRFIGYCGSERHPQFRDVPTLAEQGVANYDYSSWIALFMHKDVDQRIVASLRKEAEAVVHDKSFQQQLIISGQEPWPKSADELTSIVQADYTRWQKVIKDAKIQSE